MTHQTLEIVLFTLTVPLPPEPLPPPDERPDTPTMRWLKQLAAALGHDLGFNLSWVDVRAVGILIRRGPTMVCWAREWEDGPTGCSPSEPDNQESGWHVCTMHVLHPDSDVHVVRFYIKDFTAEGRGFHDKFQRDVLPYLRNSTLPSPA